MPYANREQFRLIRINSGQLTTLCYILRWDGALESAWLLTSTFKFRVLVGEIEENQILAWTLLRITRSDITLERSLPAVRRAYRALHGTVDPRPFLAQDCVGRLYNRLNEDYEPLHALCRFFLDNAGRVMTPVIVECYRSL